MGNFNTDLGFQLDGNGNAEINYSKILGGKQFMQRPSFVNRKVLFM